MTSHRITFMPDEKFVEVEAGTILMEAAEKAGIHINSLCGGEGVCGRCRVKLINGKARADISNLIRSKGTVFAAIKSLMEYVGLAFEDLDTLFVAGGFGIYLDIPKAIRIGLLPDIDLGRIRFIGNSSLMGARMCLLSTHSLERTAQIAKSTTNIELSTYQPFMDEYVAAMFLPHTDKRLFPSVDY